MLLQSMEVCGGEDHEPKRPGLEGGNLKLLTEDLRLIILMGAYMHQNQTPLYNKTQPNYMRRKKSLAVFQCNKIEDFLKEDIPCKS